MSDQVNKKIVGIVVECIKMTPEIFSKAISDTLNGISQDNNKLGRKISLNSLSKKGKVESIEVSESNIGSFSRVARKYNINYSLKRVKGQGENGKNLYLVCFNAKDLDTVKKAFDEYAYAATHRKETLFSKKKVKDIQVTQPSQEHGKDKDLNRDKSHKPQSLSR